MIVCTLVTTVLEEHAALEDGTLKMKAVCSFEMLATTCHQVTHCCDPESQNLKEISSLSMQCNVRSEHNVCSAYESLMAMI